MDTGSLSVAGGVERFIPPSYTTRDRLSRVEDVTFVTSLRVTTRSQEVRGAATERADEITGSEVFPMEGEQVHPRVDPLREAGTGLFTRFTLSRRAGRMRQRERAYVGVCAGRVNMVNMHGGASQRG